MPSRKNQYTKKTEHYNDSEPGVCPKCGGVDITYGLLAPEDTMIYYEAKCENKNCGCEFNEWYTMDFYESVEKERR